MAQSQTPQDRLEAALARARAHGLPVVGHGTWDQGAKGGVRFFVVGSASEPGRFHMVLQWQGRLACDCPARGLCMHRALVNEQLVAEREAADSRACRDMGGSLLDSVRGWDA
jgi:hypothetical protein